MAPRDYGHVLEEMLEAITGIEQSTAGKTFEAFSADWLLRHGVQRGIEILSEASRQLPEPLKAQHPEIPWTKVRDIGNVLRHEYHRIADGVIWAVVTDELPPLQRALAAMLAAMSRRGEERPPA